MNSAIADAYLARMYAMDLDALRTCRDSLADSPEEYALATYVLEQRTLTPPREDTPEPPPPANPATTLIAELNNLKKQALRRANGSPLTRCTYTAEARAYRHARDLAISTLQPPTPTTPRPEGKQ